MLLMLRHRQTWCPMTCVKFDTTSDISYPVWQYMYTHRRKYFDQFSVLYFFCSKPSLLRSGADPEIFQRGWENKGGLRWKWWEKFKFIHIINKYINLKIKQIDKLYNCFPLFSLPPPPLSIALSGGLRGKLFDETAITKTNKKGRGLLIKQQ